MDGTGIAEESRPRAPRESAVVHLSRILRRVGGLFCDLVAVVESPALLVVEAGRDWWFKAHVPHEVLFLLGHLRVCRDTHAGGHHVDEGVATRMVLHDAVSY